MAQVHNNPDRYLRARKLVENVNVSCPDWQTEREPSAIDYVGSRRDPDTASLVVLAE